MIVSCRMFDEENLEENYRRKKVRENNLFNHLNDLVVFS